MIINYTFKDIASSIYHFDYKGCGKIRSKVTKKYSNKLLNLWKKANEIKLSKLLLTQ